MKIRNALRRARHGALVGCCVFPAVAAANMGNVALNYGLLPSDVASAQALSLFNEDASATYYNPANLSRDPRGELTFSALHADHSFDASSDYRGDTTYNDEPTQQQLIGMKTNLGDLAETDHPLYLGVMIGVEKYGKEMMAFSSETSESGQAFRGGRNPLFLNIGGTMPVMRGFDIGVSTLVTLHSSAEMNAYSNLAGDTEKEQLTVSAKPSIKPIVGMTLNWAKMLCGSSGCEWFKGLETAIAWRDVSHGETEVKANMVIPGTIPEPGLDLAIYTIDAYQPEVITLGTKYDWRRWRFGLTLEQQKWSRLSKLLEEDDVRDQADIEFEDVLVVRAGVKYRLNEIYAFTGGIAYEPSPIEEGTHSLDLNYLDNDRIIVGLGASVDLKDPPVLAWPLSLSFGYQFQKLKEREVELYSSDAPSNPYETVTADGEAHVFSAAATIKF